MSIYFCIVVNHISYIFLSTYAQTIQNIIYVFICIYIQLCTIYLSIYMCIYKYITFPTPSAIPTIPRKPQKLPPVVNHTARYITISIYQPKWVSARLPFLLVNLQRFQTNQAQFNGSLTEPPKHNSSQGLQYIEDNNTLLVKIYIIIIYYTCMNHIIWR